jgi:hypothetical protein
MVISGYAAPFDFINLKLSYKKISYNFIHGWLVQKPLFSFVDSLSGDVPAKQPKYIALSRLGYNDNNIKLGISQIIIYANRPFEAAYLNPFLFWESAQRTMNDLDNSFLNFDFRWRALQNLEIMFTATIDDIHFGRLFELGWNIVDNRMAFQAGFSYIPYFIPDLSIQYEYSHVRPYTFTHPGSGESLTYTNNGLFLGLPFHPNSIRNSIAARYFLNENIKAELTLSRTDHGKNIYDESGRIIKNNGGNIFENFSIYDSRSVSLLSGDREVLYLADLRWGWEFIRNLLLEMTFSYSTLESGSSNYSYLYFTSALKLFFL